MCRRLRPKSGRRTRSADRRLSRSVGLVVDAGFSAGRRPAARVEQLQRDARSQRSSQQPHSGAGLQADERSRAPIPRHLAARCGGDLCNGSADSTRIALPGIPRQGSCGNHTVSPARTGLVTTCPGRLVWSCSTVTRMASPAGRLDAGDVFLSRSAIGGAADSFRRFGRARNQLRIRQRDRHDRGRVPH